jgi:hypothetical protein
MTKKTEVIKEQNTDVSAAAATLHPGTEVFNDPKAWNKTEILGKVLGSLAAMDKTTLTSWFDKVLASVGKEGDAIPDSDHSKNVASIVPHASAAVKEDVEALFAGQELTEEFKEKTTTLFEAAVDLKVKEAVIIFEEKLQAEFDKKLEEEVNSLNEEIVNKLDAYLDSIVEQWLTDNEVALVSQLKSNITEDFIQGLRNLFNENFIDIPEDKVDVIESLSEKVDSLQEQLDKSILDNHSMKIELEMFEKETALAEMSEGLSVAQKEKLVSLCESIDPDVSVETYKNKVKIIKENQLLLNKKVNTNLEATLTEEVTVTIDSETGDKIEVAVDPSIKRLAESLNYMNRKN